MDEKLSRHVWKARQTDAYDVLVSIGRFGIHRLWELPPEKRPETDDSDPPRWWEVAIQILLLSAPAFLIYIVLDEPWYVDALILVFGVLLANVVITAIFARMRQNPELWDDR